MKKIFIYAIFCLLTINAQSQSNIEITIDYPEVVQVGQQFSLTYSVNAGGGELSVPGFRGFSKIMGPQTSYSQSTQIINGKITRQTMYSYIYYLQAVKEGRYVIPPAVFALKGEEYFSDSLRIEVVGSAPQSGSSQSGTSESNTGTDTNPSDLFVSLIINRKEVYVGEPVLASIKLFSRVDLQGLNEIKYPAFNNFLRTDLETPPLTGLKQENVNGTIYGTGVIQQFLLYPQISGEIIIDPVELSVLVQQRTGTSDPFFGDFFSSYQTIVKEIASKPVSVKVKPLPGAKPGDYSGITGNLSIKANINQDSVKVNEALNFRITVAGTGNLRIAPAPKLKLTPDIEVYDPKITEQLQNGTSGTTGTKTFEYLLIPRHHGDFTIPPINYSFFNTSTGKYETLTTDEISFYAEKVEGQADAVTVYSGVSKEDVRYIGKDIRFIRSDSGKLMRPSNILSAKRWFFILYLIGIIVFFTVLFLRREHVRRNSDLSLVRNRKAAKVAGKRLHAAATCLKNQQNDKFYEEILKALWGYLSDKLNIPVAELTRNNAAAALKNKGVNESLVTELNLFLDTCEFARFAPSASGTEAGRIYEGASKFIKTVENTIR